MKKVMCRSILGAALFVAGNAGSADAATVTVANQNFNLRDFVVTNPAAPSRDFTFDGGGGNTVTVRLSATTQSGEAFSDLDRVGAQTGGHIGVGSGGDGNHVDSGEDVTFSLIYVSSTGAVDPTTLAFRFDSIGFRQLGSGTGGIRWTANGGTPVAITSLTGDAYRILDTTFTTIGMGGTYTGVFENLDSGGLGQLSALPTSPSAGDGTQGLQFSVRFDTVPEPSTALLGMIGMCGLLRRRRSNR